MIYPHCVACAATANLHHHHLVPRSLGGADVETNLITLCGGCRTKLEALSKPRKRKQRPRIKPALTTIRRHWSAALLGMGKATAATEAGACFACERQVELLERAHIRALSVGGDDAIENMHLLCTACHKASELLEGEDYLEWMKGRTAIEAQMHEAIRERDLPGAYAYISEALSTPGSPQWQAAIRMMETIIKTSGKLSRDNGRDGLISTAKEALDFLIEAANRPTEASP